MLPIYAPLKSDFDFNSSVLIKEIDQIIADGVQERTLPFQNNKSVYDQEGLLNIADDDSLNRTSRYEVKDGKRILIPGEIKTYHVFNLTYLPEEPESMIDIYRSDDSKKNIFWHVHRKPFTWRDELQNTELKKSVEQFPWEYVQGVRLITMKPPSIGQIHRDSHPLANARYYADGFASITFNIESGGGVMNYLDGKEQKAVNNNVKVFHFNDSVPHGVTPISSQRYQLRMWGKLKVPYESLLNV